MKRLFVKRTEYTVAQKISGLMVLMILNKAFVNEVIQYKVIVENFDGSSSGPYWVPEDDIELLEVEDKNTNKT